ncbi:hypothetical protein [Streptomyces sp. SHP 1-2]|uniref:hypothetical protein n=1 Tax=Streptomyces sp. SHP 1-2 TaxID=2769489 RepID=UPI002238AA20|nr:hypothetical protein [Streptomyces sp. SHP 1-2]MCW5254718.1 hypothetical protein [Streptomyces sp. SHP 1-2]
MSATATASGPVATLVPGDWHVTPEGTVLVSDVARTTGDYPAVNYTVRRCGVPVAGRGGRGQGRYIPVSEALLLVAAAALAVTAGVALAQMYRAMKAAGATVGPDALTIPLNIQR